MRTSAPSHHCTAVPRRFRRHGPPEPSLQRIVQSRAQEVAYLLGSATTRVPNRELARDRTVRTKDIRLALTVPLRCRVESESTSVGSLLLQMQRQIYACLF